MAKDKRPKAPSFVTPPVTFKWPKLSEPDFGTDKFPKKDGEFSVKAVSKEDAPEIKALLAKLQPLHDQAVEEGKEKYKELSVKIRKALEAKGGGFNVNPLFSAVYDEETEEPTGEIEMKFATGHSGKIKNGPKAGKPWKKYVPIFDAAGNHLNPTDRNGNLLKEPPSIWGGTIGRVSFEVRPYFIEGTGSAGLKLDLKAVRIIDLVSGGTRTAEGYGFEAEEEGYTHDSSQDVAPASDGEDAPAKSSDGEDDTDF